MASATVTSPESFHSDTHSMDLLADAALSRSDPTTSPLATPRTLPSMQLLPPFAHRPSSRDDAYYRDNYASRPPTSGSMPVPHDPDLDSDRDRFAFHPPTSGSSSSRAAWDGDSRSGFSDAYHGPRYTDDWKYRQHPHQQHTARREYGRDHARDSDASYERDTRSRELERGQWGSRHPSPGRRGDSQGQGHDYWRTGTVERTVRDSLPPLQIPNPTTETHWPRGDAIEHPNSHHSQASHPGRRSSWAADNTHPHSQPQHPHSQHHSQHHPSHDVRHLPPPHPDYTHGMSRRASTNGFLAVPTDARRQRSLSADEGVVAHLPTPPRVTPREYPTPERSSPPDATPRKRRPTSARTHTESRLTTPTPTPTPSFGSRTETEAEVDDLDDGEFIPSRYNTPHKAAAEPQPATSSPPLRAVNESSPPPAVRTSARLRGRKRPIEEEQWGPSPPQPTTTSTQSTPESTATPSADAEADEPAPKKRKYVRRGAEKRREQNAAAQKKFRHKKKILAEQMKTDLEDMERTNTELVAENARLAALLDEKDRVIEHLGADNDALQRHLDTCRCGCWEGDGGARHRQGRE